MPKRTQENTKDQIVRLRKAGKTYREICQEVGVTSPVVAKTLNQAGLTRPRGGGGKRQTSQSGTRSGEQSSGTGSSVFGEFMPEAPPATSKGESGVSDEAYQCGGCGARFVLEAGESLSSVACPGCGGTFGGDD